MSAYREKLRSTVAASAAPYGYTLTIWGSGAVTLTTLGSSHLLDVLLFVGGAVLAFVLMDSIASGGLRVRPQQGPPPVITPVGNAHWIAAGTSILVVWALDHLLHGTGGWPVAGFVATGGYVALSALQLTLAAAAGRQG